MMQLGGYDHIMPAGNRFDADVYHGRNRNTQQVVEIKSFKMEQPTPALIAHFKHNYETLQKADLPGVIKLLDLIVQKDRLIVVQEILKGSSLRDYLKAQDRLTLGHFLQIALDLADLIREIHKHHLVHQQLSPASIFYNADSGEIKLTHFAMLTTMQCASSFLSKPLPERSPFIYKSPEQTGRMNRTVDYRTDLYSLGVTFYEMLTGKPPFSGPTPGDLIHAHITQSPEPPHQVDASIPQVISQIIMRLLAKYPEQRYQSASGLLADLKQCHEALKMEDAIHPFAIGLQDVPAQFHIPQLLVGRTKEIEQLFDSFEQSTCGMVRVVMVTGEPGIGKSALVNELQKPITAKGGYFISGKYEQLRQSSPYSAILEALRCLTCHLLLESQASIADWRQKLSDTLGPNGKIITDIIPEMEQIMGTQPDIPELSIEASQNRFKQVIKDFVHIFADESHPLVLFLDDLQWVDAASLELIRALIQDRELKNFMLIGAYRDQEIPAYHPLQLTIDETRASGVECTVVRLSVLSPDGVNDFLTRFFHCPPDMAQPLGDVLYTKTGGRPFFLVQMLIRLFDHGLLYIDPMLGWRWDLPAIAQMHTHTEVIPFVAEKIGDLPHDSLNLIKIGACIGSRFNLDHLATLAKASVKTTLSLLKPLIAEGLLAYTNGRYHFTHDRVREATYSLILTDTKEQLHYRIGHLALALAQTTENAEDIFFIANQLNAAEDLIKDPDERLQLAEINLKAGIKAKAAAAFDAAVIYFQHGLELLPINAWHTYYTLAYGLYMEQMACRYHIRDFGEAKQLFKTLLTNAHDDIDRANAYITMILLYTTTRPPKDALDMGCAALKLFGIQMQTNVGPVKVLWELIKAKRKLKKLAMTDILELPVATDPVRMIHQKLMFSMGVPAYYYNPNLFAYIVLKGVQEVLRNGLFPHSAATFMATATMIENLLGDYSWGYEMGKLALMLNEKLGNHQVSSLVHHNFAFMIQHWNSHARQDLLFYRKAYQLSMDNGNFSFAGHSVNASTLCRIFIGEPLGSVLKENERYKGLIAQMQETLIVGSYKDNDALIRTLMGDNDTPAGLSNPDFDTDTLLSRLSKENNMYALCAALLNRTKLYYLFGHYEKARQAAQRLERHIKTPMGTLLVADHCFFYSLILTALMTDAKPLKRYNYKRIITRNQRKMAVWAELCPENFKHKWELIQAELMAVGDNWQQAPDLYQAAIDGAHHNGFCNDEAMACERLADFYQRKGDTDRADTFMQRALICFGQWGATAKQRDISTRLKGAGRLLEN